MDVGRKIHFLEVIGKNELPIAGVRLEINLPQRAVGICANEALGGIAPKMV